MANPDGMIHRCAEFIAAHGLPKKPSRNGVFLRVYGPRGARTHAVMIQTRVQADTPQAMAAELDQEPRQPAFWHYTLGRP